MSVRTKHEISDRTWFITFTCYNWLPLFETTNSYDIVYKWLNFIANKYHIDTLAFVIMPNHVHTLLYLNDDKVDLSVIIGNGKRFMAYELVERLVRTGDPILHELAIACSPKEKMKGQKHKIFEPSFDAKIIYSHESLYQKLQYIHANPVSKKWELCKEFTDYKHSSAAFYELGISHEFIDINDYRSYWPQA